MLSLITSPTHIPNSHQLFSRLDCNLISPLIFEYNFRRRAKILKKAAVLTRYLVFAEVRGKSKFGRNPNNSWCFWCKQIEGDADLESEIMDFMANSEKPTMFPTKSELMQAGRMDLVEAIKKRGGWYSLGWDEENLGDNVEETMDFDIGEFQRRVGNCKESASLRKNCDDSISAFEKEDGFSSESNSNSGSLDSPQSTASAASLGRSLETDSDEDAGIEGILSRLEKQRNSDFGTDLERNRYKAHAKGKDKQKDRHFDTTLEIARIDFGGNGRLAPGFHHKGILNASDGASNPNIEPETWRTWSNQRAGIHYTDFEAAEISFSKNHVETDKETYSDGITVNTEEYAEGWYKHKDINHNQIQTRLQHLESELTTALNSLRSEREESMQDKVAGCSSDLRKLSDDIEFQENEFMTAKERLRSIRAKLAVLEGKMALAIIDAQKIVEVKQKHIDDAHKALQLLRTTCIVWPNSASEVLLAGSFDGWTTQRKMEKSRTSIFSVSLKLYPGRYEIKFIVDGIWKVDPLRPIINNNGYENNLLIIT